MAPPKRIILVLIVNLCVVLCASLPWTNKQNGETVGTLYGKFFPSQVRSIQDSYDKYPWHRNEDTGPLLSVGESQDENTASKFQTEQSLRKKEMESNLLQELLNWEKRRLQKATLSDARNEKREPQRCYGGQWGGCRKGRRVFNNEMKVMDSKAGSNQMDDKDIDTLKKYNMAVDKALRDIQVEIPGM